MADVVTKKRVFYPQTSWKIHKGS